MPLVLSKEDGTGKVDANSFATAADGDAYHDAHRHASAWTGATTQNKETALVMVTRLRSRRIQLPHETLDTPATSPLPFSTPRRTDYHATATQSLAPNRFL